MADNNLQETAMIFNIYHCLWYKFSTWQLIFDNICGEISWFRRIADKNTPIALK